MDVDAARTYGIDPLGVPVGVAHVNDDRRLTPTARVAAERMRRVAGERPGAEGSTWRRPSTATARGAALVLALVLVTGALGAFSLIGTVLAVALIVGVAVMVLVPVVSMARAVDWAFAAGHIRACREQRRSIKARRAAVLAEARAPIPLGPPTTSSLHDALVRDWIERPDRDGERAC